MYMYFNCDNVIFNLQVVVKVLHIPVHVDQGGLVSYLISNLQVVVKVLHIHVHVDQGGLVSYLFSNLQVYQSTLVYMYMYV
jgi:hypothetical protein